VKLVHDLVETYMSNPMAIIVLTISCKDDPENQVSSSWLMAGGI